MTGDEEFAGRLCIPYLTRTGVVTLRFRRLPTERDSDGNWIEPPGAKYLSIHGDLPRLYNVEALFKPGPDIAICEGELDTGTVDQIVGVPAVGCQGASTWRPLWARMFGGYDRVLIVEDADPENPKSGKRAGSELTGAIREDIRDAIRISLPEGEDANSFVNKYGAEAMREKMGISEPV